MILFFRANRGPIVAVKTGKTLSNNEIEALQWLFGEATVIDNEKIDGYFIGPRREMITPLEYYRS